MDKVRIGVVGVSGRGRGLMGLLLGMPDVEVVGVSDLYADRLAQARNDVIEKRGNTPMACSDFRELLDIKDLDAILTASSWTAHAEICIASMEAGKYVATEVGGATSVEQCWELVRVSERTKIPCMLLENCCYGREELTIFNMVKQGMFGELVHAEGGYEHDLRDEICNGRENRHYRLANYSNRNGEVYPTHELGPIAKCLGINRGNRMISLTATASKARGLHAWLEKNRGPQYDLYNRQFTMGDVVTTVIKCAHGETIVLTHDTTLPRPYSRGNRIQGTKGIWMEDKYGVYFDGVSPTPHAWESLNNYYEKYEHPLWKWYRSEGVKGGHGGMDYLVLRAFVEAVKAGTQTPIDVYDTAAWMAVACLSEDSIAMGSAPVAVPDFTNGKWFQREPPVLGKYCLEEVCPAE
mgnify:CR=1 FL=1